MNPIVRSRSISIRLSRETPGRRLSFIASSSSLFNRNHDTVRLTFGMIHLTNVNPRAFLDPQIGFPDAAIGLDFGGRSAQRHAPGLQHVGAVGDGKRSARILFLSLIHISE